MSIVGSVLARVHHYLRMCDLQAALLSLCSRSSSMQQGRSPRQMHDVMVTKESRMTGRMPKKLK
jgi:hypothetical protein